MGSLNRDATTINSAIFNYSGALKGLLVRRFRQSPAIYRFKGTPGIKDPIESMGVPHTEVDVIIVNGQFVNFSYQLQHNDSVSVFAHDELQSDHDCIHLIPEPSYPISFILDVHLGSLARYLRLLGFDSYYRNDLDDSEILSIALESGRIVLTRDLGILKHRRIAYGYLVRSQVTEEQIKEIVQRFKLLPYIQTFKRCMVCNGLLESVDKEAILDRLEPKTRIYYHDFQQCSRCKRLYWQGSHLQSIQKWLQSLLVQMTAS